MPSPTSFETTMVGAFRLRIDARASADFLRIADEENSAVNKLDTHRVKQSIITTWFLSTFNNALFISIGASLVDQ
jgi:hypothetical protein